jgi:hypothetical protein
LATKLIDEVYGAESSAKTPAAKLAMAKKVSVAAESDKNAGSKYALLMRARTLGVDAGDIAMALSAVEKLDAVYEVDELALAKTTLMAATRTLATAAQKQAGYSASKKWAEFAIAAEQFELANNFAELCVSFARGTNDPIYQKESAQLILTIREANSAATQAKLGLAILATKPDDPAANLWVGIYRCYYRGTWEEGLPNLAKGSSKTLAELAKLELSAPETAADQCRIADGWWDAAQQQSSVVKPRLLEHAGVFYHAALPDLSGVIKDRAAKRLQESAFRPESVPEMADPFLTKFLAKIPRELLPKTEDAQGDSQAKLTSFQKWLLANKPIENGTADVAFTAKFLGASMLQTFQPPAGELTDGPRPQRYLIKFQLRMDTRGTPVAVTLNIYKNVVGKNDPALAAIAALEKGGAGVSYHVTSKVNSVSAYFGKGGAKAPAYLGLTLIATTGDYSAKPMDGK